MKDIAIGMLQAFRIIVTVVVGGLTTWLIIQGIHLALTTPSGSDFYGLAAGPMIFAGLTILFILWAPKIFRRQQLENRQQNQVTENN